MVTPVIITIAYKNDPACHHQGGPSEYCPDCGGQSERCSVDGAAVSYTPVRAGNVLTAVCSGPAGHRWAISPDGTALPLTSQRDMLSCVYTVEYHLGSAGPYRVAICRDCGAEFGHGALANPSTAGRSDAEVIEQLDTLAELHECP